MPKISVLLPTYNGSAFLARAVASVRRQTFPDWELLILDDGSTDGTSRIARDLAASDPRIRYLPNHANLGIQRTLNQGLRESTAEFVARIDDDDFWNLPDKLQLQVDFLEKHPDYVLVGTGTIVVDPAGEELFRFLPPLSDPEIRAKLLRRNCFTHASVLFRRESVLAEGGYGEGEDTRHVEDFDLWLRLGRKGKMANIPRYAVSFTLRPENISARNKAIQLKRDLGLVRRYGRDYPNYYFSLLYGTGRLWAYAAFTRLPKNLQRFIFAKYKSI